MRILVAVLFVVFVSALSGRPRALLRTVPLLALCVAMTVAYLSVRAY